MDQATDKLESEIERLEGLYPDEKNSEILVELRRRLIRIVNTERNE